MNFIIMEWIKQVLPALTGLRGSELEFANGELHCFATIIFATGFKRATDCWLKVLKSDSELLNKACIFHGVLNFGGPESTQPSSINHTLPNLLLDPPNHSSELSHPYVLLCDTSELRSTTWVQQVVVVGVTVYSACKILPLIPYIIVLMWNAGQR